MAPSSTVSSPDSRAGSDALDKTRFMSLTDPSVLGEGDTAKLEMKLVADKDQKTLTLIDRGTQSARAARSASDVVGLHSTALCLRCSGTELGNVPCLQAAACRRTT